MTLSGNESGVAARILHPGFALVGYSIITALVFGGLFASSFNMFVVVFAPTCLEGTTSSPYPFELSANGNSTPSTGPNAPNADSVPFCSSDALYSAVEIEFLTYGYLGLQLGHTDFFSASRYQTETFPFCFKLSNGTCPTQSDEGANFQAGVVRSDSTFLMTDRKKYLTAIASNSFLYASFNNFPVTFGPSGAALPGGIDASKTYYIRDYTIGANTTFRIAADTTSLPMTFTSFPSNTIQVTFPTLGSCPAEQNVFRFQNAINPSNVKLDGTLKTNTGTCGYCLTQQFQTGNRAILGLYCASIILLLSMDIMMCIPAIRKKGFFRILVIALSGTCIIFLIAAVSSAAVTFLQVARCFTKSDLSEEQYKPSPTGAKIKGYTPAFKGATLYYETPGAGLFKNMQASGVASYLKPYLVPSVGAVHLIIAIIFMFIFTIVVFVKADWAAASSTDHELLAIPMTQH